MDKYIFNKPFMSYLEELVDFFTSSVRDVKEVNETTHHEVELIIIKPPIITLTNLYNMASSVESYIEFTMLPVNKPNTKFRNKIPLSKIHGLDVKNNQLVESIDNIIWEQKVLVNQKKIEDNANCIIKHSTEEKTVFVDYKKYNTSIKLELVNLIQAKLNNIVIDFKLKYFLGSGAQSANSSSLLCALNHPKNKPNTTLEFEIMTSTSSISKESLLNELVIASNALFLSHPSFVILCPPLNAKLKTHMLKKQEIINLNLENLYVTSKTDGVFTQIYIVKNKIYCYFTHLGYIKQYDSNVTLQEPVHAYAEMYKQKNTIYLSVIKVLLPELEDRIVEFTFINNKLRNLHNRIIFCTKKYEGPFDSTSDLVEYIENALKTEQEGIVLFYSLGQKSWLDYKIKINNTIDQCVNIIYRYMSSEPVVYNDVGSFIEYKRYSNDKGFPKEFGSGKLDLNDDIKYINNIYCIKFTNKNSTNGIYKIVLPVKFIAEFSHNDAMITYRMDKTMKYLFEPNYYGNQLSVVMDHINDQKIKINDIFEEEKLAEIVHSCLKDSMRLNSEGNYFLTNRVRGPLGVLSNYVKTLLISLYCSKTYLDDHVKRKVLAVDFGNGADLEKYFYGEISVMVATDPDDNAIKTGKKRYNTLNSGDKSKYYKFTYIKETIRSETYISSIRNVFYFGLFTLVDWQFAIHYSFHPKHYSTVMNNLKNLTSVGCKVLISCMDGYYLKNLKEKKKFVINKSLPESENYLSVEKISDDQALVYNPSSMCKPMTEYIVLKDNLVRVFNDYGFKLIDYCTFESVIRRNVSFINDISKLENRTSTKNFFELNRKALIESENTDVLELLKYYVVYVFYKV